MRQTLSAYLVAMIAFGIVDLIWISNVAAPMFRDMLQDALATDVRLAPAIAFYVVFPAGLTYFAILPGLKSASVANTLISGGLFGLFTYATYDLTNYATLKGWTLETTLIDIAYGIIASALVAALSHAITQRVFPHAARSR